MIKIQKYLWPLLIVYIGIGWYYPYIGSVALICMLAPVILSFWKGRYWCGNLCPRGSFFDHLVRHISPRRKVPAFVRKDWFRIAVFVLIITLFVYQMLFHVHSAAGFGKVFLRMIVITTAMGIVLALVFQPRSWCAFCPMGSLANWISRWRRIKPRKISDKCVSCRLCTRICPMEIELKKPDPDNDSDCISCGKCQNACPKNAINF